MPIASRRATLEMSDAATEEREVMDSVHDWFRRQGLVRSRDDRVLAGVCAALGRRFGADPWPARVVFVLGLGVIPGLDLLVYPILWILMPSEAKPVPAATVPPAMPPAPTV
jgi:phage shock protein C